MFLDINWIIYKEIKNMRVPVNFTILAFAILSLNVGLSLTNTAFFMDDIGTLSKLKNINLSELFIHHIRITETFLIYLSQKYLFGQYQLLEIIFLLWSINYYLRSISGIEVDYFSMAIVLFTVCGAVPQSISQVDTVSQTVGSGLLFCVFGSVRRNKEIQAATLTILLLFTKEVFIFMPLVLILVLNKQVGQLYKKNLLILGLVLAFTTYIFLKLKYGGVGFDSGTRYTDSNLTIEKLKGVIFLLSSIVNPVPSGLLAYGTIVSYVYATVGLSFLFIFLRLSSSTYIRPNKFEIISLALYCSIVSLIHVSELYLLPLQIAFLTFFYGWIRRQTLIILLMLPVLFNSLLLNKLRCNILLSNSYSCDIELGSHGITPVTKYSLYSLDPKRVSFHGNTLEKFTDE